MSDSFPPNSPQPGDLGSGEGPGSVSPIRAPRADLSPSSPALKGMDSMGFVMDVPVELTVELGRKRVRIGDVLRLSPGSILELDKTNGDPLDIYVNERLVARAEAVVIGERYGVRITEVLVVEETRGKAGKP